MLEPADIAVEESAQIVHAVFEHRQAIDPAAEREALPLVRIEPAISDHSRVHHPRAEYLHPALLAPDDAAPLLHRPADIDLGRRLSEGEVRGAHADDDVVAFEESLEERLQRPF